MTSHAVDLDGSNPKNFDSEKLDSDLNHKLIKHLQVAQLSAISDKLFSLFRLFSRLMFLRNVS